VRTFASTGTTLFTVIGCVKAVWFSAAFRRSSTQRPPIDQKPSFELR
jgi:hypothetical protein